MVDEFQGELQNIIEGALFDFLGFLTTRETEVTLGASHESPPVVAVLEDWREKRGLFRASGEPRVNDWQERGEHLKVLAAGPLTEPDLPPDEDPSEPFTPEDVDHVDDAICEIISMTTATALPGIEHARNKIARRAGVPLRAEGGITYEARREDPAWSGARG